MPERDTKSFYGRYWENKREYHATIRKQGRVLVTSVASRLQVISPFNPEFREGAKRIGGFWRSRSRVWTFPGEIPDQRIALAELLARVYGADTVPEWLTARPCPQCQQPISIAKRELCLSCERALRPTR
jgi:hypothetical protein